MSGEQIKPGYKRTEVGVIPEDWVIGSVGELVEKVKSGLSRQLQTQDIGMPVITSGNIQNNRLVTDDLKYWHLIDPQGANNENYILEDGNILLCFINSLAQIGKPCIFRDIGRPVIYTTNIFRIVASKQCSPEFLYYLLSSVNFQNELQLIVKPAINQASFTKTDFLRIPAPFPPKKSEQCAIATALSDMDALLAQIDQLIAKKRDLKQATMQQLLTGQTRLPGFSGEWEVKRLGDVLTEIGDGATPSTAKQGNFGGSIAWVVIEDIKDEIWTTRNTLTDAGLQSCAAKLWPIGTLIISTGATIGEVGIARTPLATKQGICGLVFDPKEATSVFMKYWFASNKSFLLAKAQGSSIKEVRAPTLVQFEVALPKVIEQTAITTVLSNMDAELDALEIRRDKTSALKQGLMQELLTGHIRLI